MTTLTITQDQRDGLLYEADDDYRFGEEGKWWSDRWAGITRRVIDDLVLPDADGHYHLESLSRPELIEFLEHTLRLSLETGLESVFLRSWHTSVALLEHLGHQVNGSIYDRIRCSCDRCSWDRECEVHADAELAALGDGADDEAKTVIRERYLDMIARGPWEAA